MVIGSREEGYLGCHSAHHDQRDKEGDMIELRESYVERLPDAWCLSSSERQLNMQTFQGWPWRINTLSSCAPTSDLLPSLCWAKPSPSSQKAEPTRHLCMSASGAQTRQNRVERGLRATKTANSLPYVKLFFIFTCSCRRYMCSLIQMPNSKEG